MSGHISGLTPPQRVLLSVLSVATMTAAVQIANIEGIPAWLSTMVGMAASITVVFREWYGYASPPKPETPV